MKTRHVLASKLEAGKHLLVARERHTIDAASGWTGPQEGQFDAIEQQCTCTGTDGHAPVQRLEAPNYVPTDRTLPAFGMVSHLVSFLSFDSGPYKRPHHVFQDLSRLTTAVYRSPFTCILACHLREQAGHQDLRQSATQSVVGNASLLRHHRTLLDCNLIPLEGGAVTTSLLNRRPQGDAI